MIARYICPTCGYEFAVWHLRLNTCEKNLYENCISRYITMNSHVEGFVLNRVRGRAVKK